MLAKGSTFRDLCGRDLQGSSTLSGRRTVDKRQLLEGIGVVTHIGELADDVVLACRAGTTDLTPMARATLEEALTLAQALSEFERPAVLSPASLDCMAAAEAVSESVERLKPSADPRVLVDVLTGVAEDIQRVLDGDRTDELLQRVQAFFSQLATGMLQSSELLVRPHVREFAWTTTALSY
jgi:glycine/D-amino acid oxidase-like deaminating enzyme